LQPSRVLVYDMVVVLGQSNSKSKHAVNIVMQGAMNDPHRPMITHSLYGASSI
jgi:hypothetical protein